MNWFQRIFKNRIIWLIILMIVALLFVVNKLYVIQIIEGKEHEREAKVYSTYQLPLDAPRGNIYDKNGLLLAGNRTAYKLYMINTEDPQDYRDRMYLELINIMDKNGDIYYNYLADYLQSPVEWGTKITQGEDAVYNKKAWINSIVTSKSDKDYFDTPENAFNYLRYSVFEISDEFTDSEAFKIMIFRYNWFIYGLDTLKPTIFATDVCEESVQEITAKSINFRGVTSEKTYYRTYVNCETLGAVVGYVRAIDENEFDEKKEIGYYQTDVVGKLGIELACENYLRGVRGHRDYEKDTKGNVTEVGYTPPTPGNDVYLTIDAELQQVTFESVEANVKRVCELANGETNFGDCDAGAVIVSDVNTGEVLTMVTYPTFDNNIYVAPLSDTKAQQKIERLLTDEKSASINRAAMSAYPIGSMMKPIVAIAALETKSTDTSRTVSCPGYIIIQGKRMKCLGVHGEQNLQGAMARSCNCYFCQIGVETGIDAIDKYSKAFGLGEYSGIEISEAKGTRSNPATMDIFEAGTYHKWSDVSTAATSIGQLYTTFTPIQVNRYTAAIANGGNLVSMHLVGKIVDENDEIVFETQIMKEPIDVSDSTINTVKKVMNSTVDLYADLQSYLAAYPKRFVAGKTGTAQTGTNVQSSHGFYTCYLPSDKPEIAVTLLLEHGAYSGTNFYTLKDICDCYFGGSYTPGKTAETDYYENDTLSYSERGLLSIIRER